jgi:GAG-pre-integrase domain
MSVGHLLNDGLKLEGSYLSLEFSAGTSSTQRLLLQFKPYCPGQNIYWLSARLTSRHAMLALSSVFTVDYNIMHRRFAHPNKDVLRHASRNTQNLPSNMLFLSTDPVCQGCAEGKMTRSSFLLSPGRSKVPFDKIHMDPKEFSVQSYNKYKFCYNLPPIADMASRSWAVFHFTSYLFHRAFHPCFIPIPSLFHFLFHSSFHLLVYLFPSFIQ